MNPARSGRFAVERDMRNILLFAAVGAVALLVTIDVPGRPEAVLRGDFEPATQADTWRVTVLAPTIHDLDFGA
jgi:hypothetical protein